MFSWTHPFFPVGSVHKNWQTHTIIGEKKRSGSSSPLHLLTIDGFYVTSTSTYCEWRVLQLGTWISDGVLAQCTKKCAHAEVDLSKGWTVKVLCYRIFWYFAAFSRSRRPDDLWTGHAGARSFRDQSGNLNVTNYVEIRPSFGYTGLPIEVSQICG